VEFPVYSPSEEQNNIDNFKINDIIYLISNLWVTHKNINRNWQFNNVNKSTQVK